jgi:hypothetical protein
MDLMTNDRDVTGEEEAAEMKLTVKILTPETSTFSSTRTVGTMLEGTNVWATKRTFAGREESVILGVADGSRVTSLKVATYRWGPRSPPVEIHEVNADGTVGATLIFRDTCGMRHSGESSALPRSYAPESFAVNTHATKFLFSVKHTSNTEESAGFAIARFYGSPPRPRIGENRVP